MARQHPFYKAEYIWVDGTQHGSLRRDLIIETVCGSADGDLTLSTNGMAADSVAASAG